MGFLDLLSDAGDTIGKYFADRFTEVGHAYRDAWNGSWTPQNKSIWGELSTAWSGVTTIASSLQPDTDSFGKGLRLFLDGTVGAGSKLLQGTVGGVLEAPGLHETMWGLDKAYRYGIARPISWGLTNIANAGIAATDAHAHGGDGLSVYLDTLLSKDTFIGERGMWSDQIGKVTPGQAIIWAAGGLVGQLNPGNTRDPAAWLRGHDPRTTAGQATFNSENAEFLLKYGSGTLDLLANVAADPSHGTSMAVKAGKAKLFDHVATPDYIARGGIEKEITTKSYKRVYEESLIDRPPEALRDKIMPNARFGGQAAAILQAAAKLGEDTFRDAYVVARGMDGLRAGTGTGAWDRLAEQAPRIASDFARYFANWNIGEDSMHLGLNAQKTAAVESLVRNDFDAYVAGMINREGIWGTIPGVLMNEAQPKVTLTGPLRAGIHKWAMDVAPVMMGNPLAKAAQMPLRIAKNTTQRFMPSQGWSPFLDSMDPTSMNLRQFKANLERGGMAADRVEFWASNWGTKLSPEGRNQVYERAEKEGIEAIAARVGMHVDEVKAALPAINEFRAGARQLISRQRVYISERAARLAAVNVALGRAYEGKALKELSRQLSLAAKRGHFGDLYSVLPNVDGHPNPIPLPDTREMPPQAPDVNRPVALSQTERMIPTLDLRALEGQLRWYKRQHPVPMFEDPTTGVRRPPVNKAERAAAEITKKEALLKPLSKLHSSWDALITSADFMNMVWKSSALLRPAQMPRNLADDVLRRYLVFGKLPLIMSAMHGTKRAIQNTGRRGVLWHERVSDYIARRGADRTRTLYGQAAGAPLGPAPKPVKFEPDQAKLDDYVKQYKTIGEAWKDGAISLDDLVKMMEWMRGTPNEVNVPLALVDAMDARDRGIASVHEDLSNPAKVPAGNKPWHERAFKRRIIEYYDPAWSTKFLDDVRLSGRYANNAGALDPKYNPADERALALTKLIHKHTTERYQAGTAAGQKAGLKDPYRPGQMVINPFTGEIPKGFDSLHDFRILYHQTLDIKDSGRIHKTGRARLTAAGNAPSPSKALLDFVVDNVDDLKTPGRLLSMSVLPDGNIRIGVAEAKPAAVAAVGRPVKSGAKQRQKNFKFDGILDVGHTDIELSVQNKDGNGPGVIKFPAAFGGEAGQEMQHRLSAEGGAGSHNYLTSDFNMSRMLDQMGGWGNINPGEKGHAQSWERDVNAQLAGDPVARKFLEGETDSDVLTWLESTAEGTRYLHRMHYFGTNYVDHIRQIEGWVNEYVPLEDSKAGRNLRQRVLDRNATYDDLRAVRPNISDQPPVHGASLKYTLGKGAVFDMVSRGVDNAQKLLSDIPTDKASRFPFFSESYRRHLSDLVRVADLHAGRAGEFVPTRLLENLEKQARDRALYDTRYHLYDVAQLNDLARLTRFIVPFSSAIMDSYIKYGRIIRDNPGTILQGLYYWQMFERNSQVQDENGYLLQKETNAGGSVERWYSVNPETGEKTLVPPEKVGSDRYVQFRLPSAMGHLVGRHYFGVDLQPVMAINQKSFNVFLDLPSTGPLVAIPVNEFSLSHPEFGESEVIKKFVLPFGPSTNTGKVFLPSTVRTAWDAFAGQDGLTAEGQAKAIFQAELIAYNRGERSSPPSFVEVRERAAMMQGLRFQTAFFSPVSFQAQSPYQPYIDVYRQLASVDPKNADEAFLARYGDELYAVAMTVTRNNASVRSTLESYKTVEKYKDLIAAYPDLAGLIVGKEGAGAFSKAAYEAQKEQPMRPGSGAQKVREVMNLEDSVADLEKRRVWQEYSKMHDLLLSNMADKGLTTLRGKRAADLKKVQDSFVESNKYWIDPVTGVQAPSPWFKDYTSTDQAAMDNRIEALWQIVQDPVLQKRDDIRGLIDYLTVREQTQNEMTRRGFKSLASQKAAKLAEEWTNSAFRIREANPAFGDLWNRWLSHDDQLQLSTRKAV